MAFPIIIILGLLAIAAAAILGPRLGVAAPLLLVGSGIGVGLLPFVPAIAVEPHWILVGVLPPLLYAASVSMPAMDFRREFTAISGLAVLLVAISAALLGLLFAWLIPGLGLAGGIALGAIVSPTDAVATAIVRRASVTPRIVAVLEGEGLLNDATALVVLRSAIAATTASVSAWGVFGDFLYAYAVAVALGALVGTVSLLARSRVRDATVNTIISFAVPFVAALPAEALGASGLVAAVIAGLISGQGAARYFSPQHRLSNAQNWRAIALILEGAVFLVMGIEVRALVEDLTAEGEGIAAAIGLAATALVLLLAIRAAYVTPLIGLLRLYARRGARLKPQLAAFNGRLGASDATSPERAVGGGPRQPSQQSLERYQAQVRRKLADIDYFLAEPLGWREGTILVWAGMRGVVTLAAAQTLPAETPHRALLIFVAFLVAVSSLVSQGGTLPQVIRIVKPAGINQGAMGEERARLRAILVKATDRVLAEHDDDELVGRFRARLAQVSKPLQGDDKGTGADLYRLVRHEALAAQREALLAARAEGTFSADTLTAALEVLDAEAISLELRSAADRG